MIPSAFVVLEDLPRTPSGKIDRRMLPEPGNARPELEAAFVAPGTGIEEKLARIWLEVLLLDRVGIHDNFFDLGGYSISATRVVSHQLGREELDRVLTELESMSDTDAQQRLADQAAS